MGRQFLLVYITHDPEAPTACRIHPNIILADLNDGLFFVTLDRVEIADRLFVSDTVFKGMSQFNDYGKEII